MEKGRDWRPNNQQSSNWQHNLIRKEKKEFPACKYCQQTNHFEEWCWYKNVQCRNCNQFGHIQNFCKTRVDEVKQAQEEDTSEIKDEFLFVATIQ
jgi:hypothetical protein